MQWFSLSVAVISLLGGRAAGGQRAFDVVVYGGTSSGVVAAATAGRLGKSVVLIEPGHHLGGLTSGGLGATDIGNKAAIGGMARDFYRRVAAYYHRPEAWKWQRRDDYRSGRQRAGEATMWTFEPHVAEQLMRQFVDDAGVDVVLGQRLDRLAGVTKRDSAIASIRMETGQVYRGKRFIDATYEGDLLAAAGVGYRVGREAEAIYHETLNGVRTRRAVHHQMQPGVDPYVRAGEPASGLLPGVHAGSPGQEGAGDRRVQAACFRMCLTDVPENQIPLTKPPGYDPLRYELLFRNFEAGETRVPWHLTPMPNGKTDINNNHGFSTDYIGMSDPWPEASYAQREAIYREHLRYQQGLMWTLAHHPRVPAAIRHEVGRWGNCRDEFPEQGGWSHQLYVREARRMVSDYVMTQHHCLGEKVARQPVALAAYTMDSHHVQRYVDRSGHVRNEGDVQVGGFPPYGVDYRSMVPKESECTNLLVPVCLSASHIAYGSIRMEPVFMVLGQSAATAACQSIDNDVGVQRIDYGRLRRRLLTDGQRLQWPIATQTEVPFREQMFVYKTVGTLPIRADVMRPNDDRPRPVAVWIHGGALIVGHRAQVPAAIRARLLDAGYVLVSIDYRLAPETRLPQIVEDIEDAMAWIARRGPALFHAGPRPAAVLGASAGGYLALVAGHRADPRPAAVVALWGYGDLVGDWYSKPSPHARHHRVVIDRDNAWRQVSGPPISDARHRRGDGGEFYQFCRQHGLWPRAVSGWDPHRDFERFVPFMPVRNVTDQFPPTLLVHGTKDTDVPYEQSLMMARQLKAHRVPYELVTVEGAEHGLAGASRQEVDAAYDTVVAFVRRYADGDR